jgi:carbonic anhydrase
MPDPAEMLAKNRNWAKAVSERDPKFFQRLAEQQKPDCLWIGCSDSRVPATQIVDVPPGEIFVHRNVANQVIHTDLNCQSVIQFAVDVLKVKHIVICGHYRCGGIIAAAENQRHGLVDQWLHNLVDLFEVHRADLDAVADDQKRDQLQSELGVIQQVSNVATTTTLRDAWARNQPVSIHGWVYDVADGLVKDLQVSIDPGSDEPAVIKAATASAIARANQTD